MNYLLFTILYYTILFGLCICIIVNIFCTFVNFFIDTLVFAWYNESMEMEYVTKELGDTLRITGIVNLHFFDFDNDFATVRERHPFYEMIFVNSGSMAVSSEEYSGPLEKNQMIIHRAGEEHLLRCGRGEAPSVVIIGFTCDSALIDCFSHAPLSLGAAAVKRLAEIVKEGRNVFRPPYDQPVYDMKKKRHQPFGAEQLLRLSLESFLILLLREYRTESAPKESEPPTAIAEVVAYVGANYLERVTIDELAFLFKTNRATLCREFKTATGKTLVAFINEKKIARAKEKIATTEKTFTQIAEEMNFQSIHYFTRFFKKMTGMSPKEYRQSEKM